MERLKDRVSINKALLRFYYAPNQMWETFGHSDGVKQNHCEKGVNVDLGLWHCRRKIDHCLNTHLMDLRLKGMRFIKEVSGNKHSNYFFFWMKEQIALRWATTNKTIKCMPTIVQRRAAAFVYPARPFSIVTYGLVGSLIFEPSCGIILWEKHKNETQKQLCIEKIKYILHIPCGNSFLSHVQ